ncbi:MAG: DUF547 domain-containing protein [Chromatiales bacterium]|jgi:hypothetical protein|nr:DUF547 domain-containing protein [Chromatiales bacterium]
MTLRSYENDIIRPLGDPRVHFALNCMSVGCPVLPRVAFEASTRDATLEQEARKFLAEDRNVHIDAQHKTVA